MICFEVNRCATFGSEVSSDGACAGGSEGSGGTGDIGDSDVACFTPACELISLHWLGGDSDGGAYACLCGGLCYLTVCVVGCLNDDVVEALHEVCDDGTCADGGDRGGGAGSVSNRCASCGSPLSEVVAVVRDSVDFYRCRTYPSGSIWSGKTVCAIVAVDIDGVFGL